MNPLSPKQILRNLENGFFMTHQEQTQAADYIRQLQQAVLNEREACAKLCENGAFLHDQAPDALFGRAVARAIRARGNHEQD